MRSACEYVVAHLAAAQLQNLRVGIVLVFAVGGTVGLGASVRAQDPNSVVSVYLHANPSQPLTGVISDENVKGVQLQGRPAIIPAETIYDVDYGGHLKLEDRVATIDQALRAERLANAAKSQAERSKQLQEAIGKYQAALTKMPAALVAARRHANFKIGYLRGVIALENNKSSDRRRAIAALTDFKKKNADSWQFARTMEILARLQAKDSDFSGVKQTVGELTKSGVPAAIKYGARLMLADLLIEGKKYGDARKTLQGLIAELPKSSPLRMRARLADTVCLAVGENKLNEAVTKLKEILKETKDKSTRAAAYNALGECYYRKDQLQQARWQFLWVDVVYNQDPEEHAKALYYLWRIFSRLGEADRGQEFYDTLINGPQYADSTFRRRAIEERKRLES